MWSFWKVLRMCFSTAWSVMTSRAAMPLLERPSAISATTSRVDAQLLELSHSGGRERLAAELGQRCIAPELECIVQKCGLALVVRRSPRFRPQLGKAVEVQDSALDVEDVPRCARPKASAVLTQRLSKAGNIDLQRRPRSFRRRVAPELLDQSLGGEHSSAAIPVTAGRWLHRIPTGGLRSASRSSVSTGASSERST